MQRRSPGSDKRCFVCDAKTKMFSWDVLAGQTLTTFSWHLLQDTVWILHDTRLLHFDVCGNFFSAHAQWYRFVLRGYTRWTCWKANLIGPLFLHLPPYSHMDVCLKWLPVQAVNWAEIKGGQGEVESGSAHAALWSLQAAAERGICWQKVVENEKAAQ